MERSGSGDPDRDHDADEGGPRGEVFEKPFFKGGSILGGVVRRDDGHRVSIVHRVLVSAFGLLTAVAKIRKRLARKKTGKRSRRTRDGCGTSQS